MATNPDDINEKVDKETSFSTYIAKDLSATAMVIGGLAVGAGVGYAASRWTGLVNALKSAAKWVGRRLKPETSELFTHWVDHQAKPGVILPIAGGLAGSFVAGIPHTYAHWREGKKEQLRVEEMATDVIALREQRNTAMEALRQQSKDISDTNEAIRKIVENGPKGFDSMTANPLPKEQVERLEKRAEKPAEAQRD